MERSTIFNGKIHYFNGSFSIANCNKLPEGRFCCVILKGEPLFHGKKSCHGSVESPHVISIGKPGAEDGGQPRKLKAENLIVVEEPTGWVWKFRGTPIFGNIISFPTRFNLSIFRQTHCLQKKVSKWTATWKLDLGLMQLQCFGMVNLFWMNYNDRCNVTGTMVYTWKSSPNGLIITAMFRLVD